jgi:hypothetical protein
VCSIKQKPPTDILELYKRPTVNQISGFCKVLKELDPDDLGRAYHRTRESAPQRHARGKGYFVGHSGVTSSGANSNRREEHLAVALWNATRKGEQLIMPGGQELTFLDYQLPLKARQSDKGIGKVDLFGAINRVHPCVIELKIDATGQGLSDTPLRAFLEALAYCAIVEANARDIAKEAFEYSGLKLINDRPALVVMAPEEYWSGYINHKKTGDWWPVLLRLAENLNEIFGLQSHFIALRNSGFSMGLNGQRPLLAGECTLVSVAEMFE